MSEIEVQEGLRYQHPDESVVRSVDFDPATTAASVSSPSVKAYVESLPRAKGEVTSTVFPTNSPSADTLVVTLSALTALTVGETYRIEVSVSDGTNTLISVHRVRCQED